MEQWSGVLYYYRVCRWRSSDREVGWMRMRSQSFSLICKSGVEGVGIGGPVGGGAEYPSDEGIYIFDVGWGWIRGRIT